MGSFEIKLRNQCWCSDEPASVLDGCSHGGIELTINGVLIVAASDDEWTVSTSALQLLRTVFEDHVGGPHKRLVLHCGALMMASCPIGVSWDVLHRNVGVEIRNVVKVPTVDEANAIRFPSADCSMAVIDYARPILAFADDVAAFFAASPPRQFADESDRCEFESFIDEFNKKRERVRNLLKRG
jgi:hypothetical protein